MSSRNYISFFKIGNEQHMQNLLYEGEVFCKPLEYFRNEEQETFRHDNKDGAGYISQMTNFEAFTEDGKTLIGKAKSGQLYYYHNNSHGNVYCLYGIESILMNLKAGSITPLDLDMSALNFGDYAVLIIDPTEFVKRVQSVVEKQNFTFHYGPVNYYDEYKYQGDLGVFCKSNKFSPQKEIRFWIPNKFNKELVFKIGNIEDIARLLPKSDLPKLGFGPA